MKENGRMIKFRDKVLVNQPMEIIMMEIGKMIKDVDMDIIYGMIKTSIKVNGKIIAGKEQVYFNIKLIYHYN